MSRNNDEKAWSILQVYVERINNLDDNIKIKINTDYIDGIDVCQYNFDIDDETLSISLDDGMTFTLIRKAQMRYLNRDDLDDYRIDNTVFNMLTEKIYFYEELSVRDILKTDEIALSWTGKVDYINDIVDLAAQTTTCTYKIFKPHDINYLVIYYKGNKDLVPVNINDGHQFTNTNEAKNFAQSHYDENH